jgi:hypothetical protein
MTGGLPRTGSRFSILSIIALSAFMVAVVLAIIVFIYQRSLVQSVNKMNAELVAARTSFEPGFIDELIKLDRRISAAEEVVAKHTVTTPIFNLLENETLQGIRFVNLDYTVDAKGQPSIDMKGEAVNFLAIALQSDVFGADRKIKNPVFGGLNLDDKGIANFNFKGDLDSSAFLYKNVVEAAEGTSTDAAGG